MFTGLSAFPLTPMDESSIDEQAFCQLVARLAEAKVDSIGVLGSTGSYAYLTREERKRIIQLAVEHASGTPVIAGIGTLRTKDVLHLTEDAQQAGAHGLLLAPVSYQKLTDDEVYAHYQAVSAHSAIPICVYDNPTTTHFEFNDVLHGRIAALPNIAAIKIPPVSQHLEEAKERVARLRAHIPEHVTIGISGDHAGATGLNAGCDAWYSVLGGLFPAPILAIINASQRGDIDEVNRLSDQLEPIWAFFRRYGSLRVVATIAELKGLVKSPCLPLPIKSLSGEERQRLNGCIEELL